MSFGRRPTLRILANGLDAAGAIDAEIVSNSHFSADRFRVRLAIGADPVGWSSLIAEPRLRLDVQVSLDGGAWFSSLVTGDVDMIEVDQLGGVITMSGRDLSAALIEARTQETFANNTASEIATTLASRHGLMADVQSTTTPVGRYWQLEHDYIVVNQFGRATTEWDLLVTLAQREAFELWVSGNVLHFRPAPVSAGQAVILRPVMSAAGPPNITALRLDRSLTLAAPLQVTVKSWNSLRGAAFEESVQQQSAGALAGGTSARPLTYTYVMPNLTPDEARKYALSRLNELSQHARVIAVEMPGELVLTPRMVVRLVGSVGDFDQFYRIDCIERYVSCEHGFSQSVHAKSV